jgi:hypothetical protein
MRLWDLGDGSAANIDDPCVDMGQSYRQRLDRLARPTASGP